MIEIHLTTNEVHANFLSKYFQEERAIAVTLKDGGNEPIYEPNPALPRLWQKTILIALFEENIPDQIFSYLQEQQQKNLLQDFKIIYPPQKNWIRESLDAFKPMQFGNRLWVIPSWHTPPLPEAANVMLDPGLAFGTGSHETTTLCLEWLDKNIESGMCVIDYGCGSGILAIAAAKLGATKIYAIDNDPQALTATKNNANTNAISSLCIDSPDNIFLENASCDVLIANILAKPLIELAEIFQKYVKINGKIALSGILKNQEEAVIKAYNPWFNIDKSNSRGDWIILTGQRK